MLWLLPAQCLARVGSGLLGIGWEMNDHDWECPLAEVFLILGEDIGLLSSYCVAFSTSSGLQFLISVGRVHGSRTLKHLVVKLICGA